MLCVTLQLNAPLTTALQRRVRKVGDFKSIFGLDANSQNTAENQRSWAISVISLTTLATRSLPKMPVFYSLLVNNHRCSQVGNSLADPALEAAILINLAGRVYRTNVADTIQTVNEPSDTNCGNLF